MAKPPLIKKNDNKGSQATLIPLEPVIGMPPSTHVSDNLMYNTMPIANITPLNPAFQWGLSVYSGSPAWPNYNTLLKSYGYSLASPTSLKVAFLAENFPTDSFQNEYGQSFLSKMTDVISSGAQEISQIMGGRSLGEDWKTVSEGLKKRGGLAGTFGGMMETAGQKAADLVTWMKSRGRAGAAIGGGLELISKLAGGGRIDFPQVWKNSGYTPQYSMTIRLYNPQPGDDYSTKKYIIGPLVALLLLGLPQATTANVYSWPFLIGVNCPGIFMIYPGFSAGITVVKGGDNQSIGFNQRLSIVDVRYEVGSLFNSILAGMSTHNEQPGRPTLENYAATLLNKKDVKSIYTDPTGGYVPSATPTLQEIQYTQAPTTTDEPWKEGAPVRVEPEQKKVYEQIMDKVKASGWQILYPF